MNQNVAIVAIGTEITSGQIRNGHSQWISSQVDDFGLVPNLHLAVPDDRVAIVDALNMAKLHSKFIFVTGGLGPTKDDITRDVVSDWAKRPLEFANEVWTRVESSLNERRVKISPSHKSQAMFPRDSRILPNEVGTAQGFYFEFDDHFIWVLPGPTHELQFIWKNSVVEQLKHLSTGKTLELKKWRCLGKPESELADLVESTLDGLGVQTGYRITAPYVEVKIWMPSSWTQSKREEIKKRLSQTLAEWLVVEDDRDLALEFLDITLQQGSLVVIDDSTDGLLAERLFETRRTLAHGFDLKCLSSSSHDLDGVSFAGADFVLRVLGEATKAEWFVELKTRSGTRAETLKFQSTSRTNSNRLGKVKTELSLKKALEWMTG